MTNEDEQIRNTYAHFGLAVYRAQLLEHGIVNAMVAFQLPHRSSINRRDIDLRMERSFEQTLGKLIRELRSQTSLPADLEPLLAEALKTRNWLCHDYFRQRAVEFTTFDGRAGMIDELRRAQSRLEIAEARLTEVVRPIEERFGVTSQAIEAERRRLLAE